LFYGFLCPIIIGFCPNAPAGPLWNTIYMEAALKLLQPSLEIQEADVARLSPLLHIHINVLGRYSFTLAKQVVKDELQPLNLFLDDILIP